MNPNWLRPRSERRSASRRRARGPLRRSRRPSPRVEALEDRRLLAVPLVTFHGGTLLKSVQVVSIFYGWLPAVGPPPPATVAFENKLDTYLSDLVDSSFLGDLTQYRVGTGELQPANAMNTHDDVAFKAPLLTTPGGAPYVADQNLPGTVIDANNIQDMIRGEIAAGDVPATDLTRTLYFVWVAPGVFVRFDRPGSDVFSTQFGGYHNAANAAGGGPEFAYAVMPFPTLDHLNRSGETSAFDFLTAVGSHEVGEGVSDPYLDGWFYINTGGEIGDLTDGMNFWFTPDGPNASGNAYRVQLLWSNFIPQSNFPHALPLIGGNPALPGVVGGPNGKGSPQPVKFRTDPPPSSPPPRPTPPAPPGLPGPVPPITANPIIPGGAALVEPLIVASDANPSNLALASVNGLQVSADAGATWSTSFDFPVASQGASSLAFDKAGRLYWANLDATTDGITVSVRDPTNGNAVAGPFQASTPPPGSVDVAESLVGDNPFDGAQNDSLYLVWTRLGPSNASTVLLATSTDHGAIWSSPVTVSQAGDGYVWGATASVASDGTVEVAYHAQPGFSVAPDGGIVPDGTSGKVIVSRYTHDLSAQLTTSTALASGQADVTFNVQDGSRTIPGVTFLTQGTARPVVLADPSRPGTVYVITADDPNDGSGAGPYSRVIVARSDQSGASGSWTTTTLDNNSGVGVQLMPVASIDRYGTLVISWYDDRNGQTNSRGDSEFDTFAAYSTDGGLTFSTSFQLNPSDQPFDPDAGAPTTYPGPPPTTSIGNVFGVAVAGGTAFIAHDANTFDMSQNPVGQTVAVDSFTVSGTLILPPNLGQNVITLRRLADGSDIEEVLLNGVTVFTGPIASLAGGIVIAHDPMSDEFETLPVPPDVEDDTLILDFTNGDPIPTGGIDFEAAPGGKNAIQENADADATLSDSLLTVAGLGSIILIHVAGATLVGGASDNTFTLQDWGGQAMILGGAGTNTMVLASGTVSSSKLGIANVNTMIIHKGTFNVDTNFLVPILHVDAGGTLAIEGGKTLTSFVTNAGILAPGGDGSTGIATIAGTYDQTATGHLKIELGGTTAGSKYDRLKVTGKATLGGTLDVGLINGFTPNVGNAFQIITYGSVAGNFATVNLPNLSGKKLVPQKGAKAYKLVTKVK